MLRFAISFVAFSGFPSFFPQLCANITLGSSSGGGTGAVKGKTAKA